MGYDATLVTRIRRALVSAGDAQRAVGQQTYMHSELPFHGVRTPQVRRMVGQLVRDRLPADRGVWEATMRELWDGATHREQRYAVLQSEFAAGTQAIIKTKTTDQQ